MAGMIYRWNYSSQVVPPPSNKQLRFDNTTPVSVTKVWFDDTTVENVAIRPSLLTIPVGTELAFQDSANHANQLRLSITDIPVDYTTYVEFPVAYIADSGSAVGNSVALDVLFFAQPQTGQPQTGLIVTPADPDANSYATVQEADDYNASRPFATAWGTLSADAKEAALKYAAVLLDATFIWTGQSTTLTQALGWPRIGMLTRNGAPIDPMTIPRELKMAQAEYARQLSVSDLTATDDAAVQGISSVKAGSVTVAYQRNRTQAEAVALMNANYAYLSKNVPEAVRLLLVPSWYQQMPILIDGSRGNSAYNPFYFWAQR